MKPHLPRINRGARKTPERDAGRFEIDPKRTGLAVLTIVILSVLLSMPMLPSKVSLRLGETSSEDIVANRTARYLDTAETELRRARARDSVGRIYEAVPGAADQAINSLKAAFHVIEGVRRDHPGASVSRKVALVRERLGSLLGARVSDGAFAALLEADDQTLRRIEDESLRIVSAAMGREIRDDPADFRAARAEVVAEAQRLVKSPIYATAVGEIARESLRPNRVYDQEATLSQQQRAEERVTPVYRLIMRGDTVIAKGEPVLEEHIAKFEALGLRNPRIDYRSAISLALLVVAAVVLMLCYMARYHAHIYRNTRALLLLALIVVLSTLALRISGNMLGIKLTQMQVGYLGMLWVGATGMLVAVLVNAQVSVVIVSLLSIVLSLMLNNELRYAASTLMTSLVGIYAVANIRDRWDLLRALGLLAGAGVLLVWIMGGISGDTPAQMLTGSAWAMGAAGAATWLMMIGTALLERPFGRTTHMSLLELSDTNKKLLRRLVMEAPGTYTHSMAVGYLAETAAEAIGADGLVARVAAYYHDIGKIRRPHFFVENQHVENVHDRMNPTLSALVITSHIKDGVEIAKDYRLPQAVVDVINQHHGTSLVQYFFHQVADEQEPSTALEQQFRYPGPKPQSKEAAIVMLADAVEAASRSLTKPTPAKIELIVNRIVGDKDRDGQLTESELTFREIAAIRDCFVRALIGTMHARIDYPDALAIEGRKSQANGDSGAKLAGRSGEAAQDKEPGHAAVAS